MLESGATADATDRGAALSVHATTGIIVGTSFAVFVAAFYWFRLTPAPGAPPSSDLFAQLYPMWSRAGDWMRHGELPLWNPYQLAGQPFLASVLYGVLYPLNLTRLFVPAEVALEVNIVLHQWLGLAFGYLFLRCFCSRPASALGAVLFVFSGWIVFEASWFTGGIAAAPWLPFGMLAVERIAHGKRRWCIGLAVAICFPILAGWLQDWMYNAYAIAGFAAMRLAALHDGRMILARGWPIAAGFCIGIALAAPQLLPSVELQMLGPRAPGALQLGDILGFGPASLAQISTWAANPIEGPHFAYVGLVGLGLALFAFRNERRGVVLYLAALALLSILVAMATNTPFFWLYMKLPGASWFRAPFRIMYLYCFAVASLAAFGADAAAGLFPARWHSGVAAGLLCVAAADVFLVNHAETSRPIHNLEALDQQAPVFDFIVAHQGLDRTLIAWPSYFALHVGMKQATLRGIYGITDYEILTQARTANFFRQMDTGKDQRRFVGFLDLADTPEALRVLSLLSVRFIVVPRFSPDKIGLLQRAGWREVFAHDAWCVFESPAVFPRAYVAHNIRAAGSEQDALSILGRAYFTPWHAVAIEGAATNVETGAPIAPATVASYEPTRVVVESASERPGYLVLTDTFYPGWRATVDGQPAAIVRANSIFRAVSLPAGQHRVEFRFVPLSFYSGVVASLVALLLLAALWVWSSPNPDRR